MTTIEQEKTKDHLNQCLDYLRAEFPNTHIALVIYTNNEFYWVTNSTIKFIRDAVQNSPTS